jgi:hypothetical protein
VSRRVSLPGADELFRRTSAADRAADRAAEPGPDPEDASEPSPRPRPSLAPAPAPPAPAPVLPEQEARPQRTASGRVRHDEKMTVYITADELLELEHARLVLRRTLGSAVDRGRLVRAAVAMALADLDEHGADSQLVRRLTNS